MNWLEKLRNIIDGLEKIRDDMQGEKVTKQTFQKLQSSIDGLEKILDDMQCAVMERKLQEIQSVLSSLEKIGEEMRREGWGKKD